MDPTQSTFTCLKSTMKTPLWNLFTVNKKETPGRRHWRHSGIFIVNFEQFSDVVQMFPLLSLSRWIPAENSLFLNNLKEGIQHDSTTSSFINSSNVQNGSFSSVILLSINLPIRYTFYYLHFSKNYLTKTVIRRCFVKSCFTKFRNINGKVSAMEPSFGKSGAWGTQLV